MARSAADCCIPAVSELWCQFSRELNWPPAVLCSDFLHLDIHTCTCWETAEGSYSQLICLSEVASCSGFSLWLSCQRLDANSMPTTEATKDHFLSKTEVQYKMWNKCTIHMCPTCRGDPSLTVPFLATWEDILPFNPKCRISASHRFSQIAMGTLNQSGSQILWAR